MLDSVRPPPTRVGVDARGIGGQSVRLGGASMRWFFLLSLVVVLPQVAFAQRAKTEVPQTEAEWTALFAAPPMRTPDRLRTMTGAPGPDYWQQQADCEISATLDAEAGEVSATLTLEYTNNSPEALPYLWFHVEQNVFRADSLARAVAAAGGASADRIDATTDGVRMQSVRCRGRDLKWAGYDTLMRVELPAPVAADGGTVRLELAWSFEVPKDNSLRMGRTNTLDGPMFALAQWFPAVAKFDDVHGWNTLPYIGPGEFYTEYGDFDVALTVPRNHVVAASGTLRNPRQVLTGHQREQLDAAMKTRDTVMVRSADDVTRGAGRPEGDGPLTWEFRAQRVRTFAWCSSAALVWDACSTAAGVLCQSYYPRSALPLWNEGTQDLRQSIEHFSGKWFAYPYPQASNVNAYGDGGGGMEYPMIIFNGRCNDSYGLFALIAHEIGHNWFPMVVNTDERRHAWMDEGFNTFVDYYAIVERFNAPGAWFDLDDWSKSWQRIGAPMSTAPDRMPPGSMGFLGYDKPAWMMRMLREQVLGAERFDAAFREYVARWAFKSPTPADFMRTMENAAGKDLGWFWNSWIYGAGKPDMAAGGLGGEKAARLQVVLQGRFVSPVPWLAKLKDGSTRAGCIPAEAFAWGRRVSLDLGVPEAAVESVELDPAHCWPDMNRENNISKPGQPGLKPPAPNKNAKAGAAKD